MSKAVLVIDTPKSCHDCPVLEYCHNNDGKADLSIRQEWCPLKPLPEKIPLETADYAHEASIASGWNNCIDKLLT